MSFKLINEETFNWKETLKIIEHLQKQSGQCWSLWAITNLQRASSEQSQLATGTGYGCSILFFLE